MKTFYQNVIVRPFEHNLATESIWALTGALARVLQRPPLLWLRCVGIACLLVCVCEESECVRKGLSVVLDGTLDTIVPRLRRPWSGMTRPPSCAKCLRRSSKLSCWNRTRKSGVVTIPWSAFSAATSPSR